MRVQTSKIEIDLAVPPSRIFKASAIDFPTLAAKVLPQFYKKIDLIGHGGVGTIIIYHAQEGIFSMDAIKERVEAVDKEKLFYSFRVIHGPFPTGVEIVQVDLTFKTAIDGTGTKIKRKTYFYTTSDDSIDETEITAFNEQGVGEFKALESYLITNPDACISF